MFDFICMSIVDLRETGSNRGLQSEQFLSPVGFEPTPGKPSDWKVEVFPHARRIT